jgi:hypothetical protein
LMPQRLPISPKCRTKRWVKGARFMVWVSFRILFGVFAVSLVY